MKERSNERETKGVGNERRERRRERREGRSEANTEYEWKTDELDCRKGHKEGIRERKDKESEKKRKGRTVIRRSHR